MWLWITLLSSALLAQAQNTESNEFTPAVAATCKGNIMSIKINFNQGFNGIAHAREFRTPACMTQGNGTETLSFDINLMAAQGAPDYCGVFWNNRTDERSLPLAVRVHRTLELADDKFYVITCGKAGFRNARNETSLVSLRMLNEDGKKVMNAAFGMPYTLRAEISKSDGSYGIKLKNCFAFNMRNNTVELTDSKGCPVKQQSVTVKNENGAAELLIASMFRFPDSSQVNFQCEIGICKGI
uniref:ZP domain-containing protein n=1 Tax=Pectinophora gossypiella TaxID=13191 RepID=A0A1E1WE77_PECGO